MNNAVPIPDRIGQLADLADNLWWSWHPQARNLFKAVSYPLWKSTRHNPVRMLQMVSPGRLQALAQDQAFLQTYDRVVSHFNGEVDDGHLWFSPLEGEIPPLTPLFLKLNITFFNKPRFLNNL